MRSAFADFAGINVLRHFAPDALHSIVHRFWGLAYFDCYFLVGQAVQIEPQNLRFKLGQLVLNTLPHFIKAFLQNHKILRIGLRNGKSVHGVGITIKEGCFQKNRVIQGCMFIKLLAAQHAV